MTGRQDGDGKVKSRGSESSKEAGVRADYKTIRPFIRLKGLTEEGKKLAAVLTIVIALKKDLELANQTLSFHSL